MAGNQAALEDSFLIDAKGFSMGPFVKNGDRLIVKKANAQDLRIGDLILYKLHENGANICHRLIKKTNSRNGLKLFARGDALGFSTELITEDNLIGFIWGIIRNGRIVHLRTAWQIMFNWLIAKLYVFLRPLLIYLRKLFKVCALFLENYARKN